MTKKEVEDCQYWLDTIMDEASDQLNEWEESFLDTISDRLNQGMDLSPKQIDTLEKIYKRKTE